MKFILQHGYKGSSHYIVIESTYQPSILHQMALDLNKLHPN
jgi:hypothetical protein